jgi:hypothetical protein
MGTITSPARMRGTTRYWTGLTAIVSRASICSEARMLPSSAAMPEPARAATMMAVRTGAISRESERPTTPPTMFSAPKRRKP